MATIPENQLEISSSIGTSGYVRVVGTDGKSYRVAISTLVDDAGLGDLSDLTTILQEDFEIISEEGNWYNPDPTYTDEYFIDSSGNFVSNSDYSYSELIPIERYNEVHFRITSSDSATVWLFVATYDGRKEFLSRYSVLNESTATTGTRNVSWTNKYVNAKYIRITYESSGFDMSVFIDDTPFTLDVSTIPTPQINDLPKSLVAIPEVNFSEYVQEETGVAGAKGAVYKNGDYFVITYGENLDGTGTDIPLVSTSGCLAMKYKRFKLVDGVESEVTYGTFAQIGTTYTDYTGSTSTFVGGCGLPSGVTNMQYFTSAYTVEDTGDMNYTFSGISNYGMTPCCCSVEVTDSGVTFGTIYELTLDVDGDVGQFDLHRVDSSYWMTSYLTTTPPYRDSDGWKWLQGVNEGIAYFTSDDGINWIYEFTIPTPFQPKREVTATYRDEYMYFACRTNPSYERFTDTLFVGKINVENGYISLLYKLPFIESRAAITKAGDDILLFYSPAYKGIVDCIRITEYSDYELFFWRWFTIYEECTWYISPVIDNGIVDIYPIETVNGYFFNSSGVATANTNYCYVADYIPVEYGDTIYVNCTSDSSMTYWIKACLYDSDKTFLSRADFTMTTASGTTGAGYLLISNSSCAYIRLTYNNYSSSTTYNPVFSIYNQKSDYVSDNTILNIYAVGGNGETGSTLGMTFKQLTFTDTSKPYRPSDITASVL